MYYDVSKDVNNIVRMYLSRVVEFEVASYFILRRKSERFHTYRARKRSARQIFFGPRIGVTVAIGGDTTLTQ